MLSRQLPLILVACVTACAHGSGARPVPTKRTGMDFIDASLRARPTDTTGTPGTASLGLARTSPAADRVSIYDNALVALLLLQRGRRDDAGHVLEALTHLQREDGSLPFSFPMSRARDADPYIRSGALAWVGFAAAAYLNAERGGPGRDAILRMAHGIARYLLAHQSTANADPREGLVTGGGGTFVYRSRSGASKLTDRRLRGPQVVTERFVPSTIEWTSAEHNIDAFFFLRAFGRLTNDARYSTAAEKIAEALRSRMWSADTEQFRRGISRRGEDVILALDCASWGALFLVAVGDTARAETAFARGDARYASHDGARGVRGHKPYANGPLVAEESVAEEVGLANVEWTTTNAVWPEGSAGLALAALRLGHVERARAILDQLELLRDDGGGLPTLTLTIPFEFDQGFSLAGTVWIELVREELAHPERPQLVWPP